MWKKPPQFPLHHSGLYGYLHLTLQTQHKCHAPMLTTFLVSTMGMMGKTVIFTSI